jgi:hypothetical protein
MKSHFTIIAFLLISFTVKGQDKPLYQIDSLGNYYRFMEEVRFPFDTVTHRVTYTGVVEVKGRTSQQLYLSAKEWFAKVFNSGKAVIDLDDNVSYKLIGKGKTEFIFKYMGGNQGGYLNFTITIMAKEGRYKYIITNIDHEGNGKIPTVGPIEAEKWPKGTGNWWSYGENYKRLKQQANSDALAFIASLKEHMTKSSTSDNW